MNEYHKFIQDTYNWARYMGICRTKSEFAKIVGVCPSTISASSQERYSGKNTAKKIRAWLKQYESDRDAISKAIPIVNEIHEEHPIHYSDALVKEMMSKKEFDWNVYRAEVAGRVLAGFASKIGHQMSDYAEQSCKYAVALTDELIKQLKGHE